MFLDLDSIIEANPSPVDPKNKQIRISEDLGFTFHRRPFDGYKRWWDMGKPSSLEEEIVEWFYELSIKYILSRRPDAGSGSEIKLGYFSAKRGHFSAKAYYTLIFSRERDAAWFLLKYGERI